MKIVFGRKFKHQYKDFLLRVDAPWFNKGSVEFLDTLDLKNYHVIEFGSGSSTFYFADKCKFVNSYEMNVDFFKKK